MGNTKKKKRSVRAKKRVRQHKLSMIGVSSVMVMLALVLFVGSASLRKKNEEKKEEEANYQELIQDAISREEELDEMEQQAGSKEQIESIGNDRLGLIYENEIRFIPE